MYDRDIDVSNTKVYYNVHIYIYTNILDLDVFLPHIKTYVRNFYFSIRDFTLDFHINSIID